MQSHLTYIADTDAYFEFAHSLNAIVVRWQLNARGVRPSCREICNTLSRYPYLYDAIENQDDIVINTSHNNRMSVSDGGALEAYLQYDNFPYTAIYRGPIERFEISRSNAPMPRFELPRDINNKSWVDHFNIYRGMSGGGEKA